jgi:UDP-N-acetylglucosamine diphosphorylase/glucosamine-1-phosphate N-acetyltransferase
MKIVLCDNGLHLRFAPLTLTRPLGAIRMGILTNEERIRIAFPDAEVYYQTEQYLTKKFPPTSEGELFLNASVIFNDELLAICEVLEEGQELIIDENWIARRGVSIKEHLKYYGDALIIRYRWEIFQRNGEAIIKDFNWLTSNRTSNRISSTNTIIGDKNLIFIEEGVSMEACILNTINGPIYLGKNSEVMEGSVIRGPFALGEEACVKLATKIYGPTTIGPHCRVGGEVNNVVFQSYSNKGHDGFLGNSILGEWCNLGADTNSSNLKNNYSNVATYSYESKKIDKTDIQFMGVVMGDHSKTGINTMLNTATTVGVCSNIFGAEFPEKFIPSFSWGGGNSFEVFDKNKAVEVAKAMMERRHVEFTEGDQEIFDYLFTNKEV